MHMAWRGECKTPLKSQSWDLSRTFSTYGQLGFLSSCRPLIELRAADDYHQLSRSSGDSDCSSAHEAHDDEEEDQAAEGELSVGALDARALKVDRGHLKPQRHYCKNIYELGGGEEENEVYTCK